MTLQALFRCDGDETLGAGHVGRCLPLARALRGAGAEVLFAGRFGGVAAALLERAGMPAVPVAAARETRPDVVVADGYDLREDGLAPLRRGAPVLVVAAAEPLAPPVLALDYHIRDGAPGRGPESRGSAGAASVLSGPAYAPVAPEFAAARRRRGRDRWLVTLGGGTAGAGLVDRTLAAAAAAGAREVWLTAGAAPARVPGLTIRHEPTPTGLHEAVAWTDVAVSGAGVTAYELACAGVPTALVQVADNQAPVIAGLSRAGTAVAVAPGALETGVRAALGNAGARERMAARGPSIVDGYGAFRARDALLALLRDAPRPEPLVLRPARESDAPLLLEWRNDPEARAASRTQEVVPLPDHQRWLGAVLADPDRTLLIAERTGEPVGTVRFDRRANEAEISVAVAPSARGGGLGRRLIAEASELELEARPQLHRIVAAVRRENRRSAGVFERAGFTLVASDDEADSLLTLVLHRRRPPTDRFDS